MYGTGLISKNNISYKAIVDSIDANVMVADRNLNM